MSSLPESEHFSVWILQQQQMVMMFLGKIANPMTGENERNLEAARWHIDLLGAMQERTKGNLLEHEERLLSQVVTNLRLNFVHEANRPEGSDAADADAAGDGAAGASDGAAGGDSTGDGAGGASDGAAGGDSTGDGAGDAAGDGSAGGAGGGAGDQKGTKS